jgi:hypothetical protein
MLCRKLIALPQIDRTDYSGRRFDHGRRRLGGRSAHFDGHLLRVGFSHYLPRSER